MNTPYIQLFNLTKLTLLCFSLLLIPIQSYARNVEFAWTANSEPVTGYKLYYKTGADSLPPYDGTGITDGPSPIVLGNVTSVTLTGLSANETYHFSLTAINENDESGYTTPAISLQPIPLGSPTINIMSQN